MEALPPALPHGEGVYVYDPSSGSWERLMTDLGAALREGVNIVYFRNTLCNYCHILDLKLPDMVDMYSRCATLIVVTCGWFHDLCLDRYARRSFKEFRIRASPTIYLVKVTSGSRVKEVRYEGVPSLAELRSLILREMGAKPCPSHEQV